MRRAFEAQYQHCLTQAAAMAQGLGQPYTPPAMPLSEVQLRSLDERAEIDVIDPRIPAARSELVGPVRASVDPAEAFNALREKRVADCTRIEITRPAHVTIWDRRGVRHIVQYEGQQVTSVSSGSRPETGVMRTSPATDNADTVAGQRCFRQPAVATPLGQGLSSCLWEPFARVRTMNLPITLEMRGAVGAAGIQFETRVERVGLLTGTLAAPSLVGLSGLGQVPDGPRPATGRLRSLR